MNFMCGILVASLLICGAMNAEENPRPAVDLLPRILVLPFANYTDSSGLRDEVMMRLQIELAERSFEYIDPDRMNEVLRRNRIRLTAEPTSSELRTLTTELGAQYLLAGSIHRLVVSPQISELSVGSYLLNSASLEVVWMGFSVFQSGGAPALLSSGAETDVPTMVRKTVRDLMKDFSVSEPESRKPVTGIQSKSGSFPCDKIAVIPVANETSTSFAGELLTDQLRAALFRRGFRVVAPGLVREGMLSSKDLTRGQSNAELREYLLNEYGANILMTGTVSKVTASDGTMFGDIPELELECQLSDAATGSILWARTRSRRGDDTALLFGTHVTLGVGGLANDAARDLVHAIPLTRAAHSTINQGPLP